MLRVLGIDPGFANIGIVGLEFETGIDDARVIYAELVRTKKSKHKLDIRKNSDDQRRHTECFDAYTKALKEVNPIVVSMEGISYVRNSATMCGIGGSWYGLYYLLMHLGIYCVDYSPQELKKIATGKKNASKKEMIWAVRTRWPAQIDWDLKVGRFLKWPESKHEHVADAAIAAWAAIIDRAVPWPILTSQK